MPRTEEAARRINHDRRVDAILHVLVEELGVGPYLDTAEAVLAELATVEPVCADRCPMVSPSMLQCGRAYGHPAFARREVQNPLIQTGVVGILRADLPRLVEIDDYEGGGHTYLYDDWRGYGDWREVTDEGR